LDAKSRRMYCPKSMGSVYSWARVLHLSVTFSFYLLFLFVKRLIDL
jgi:hypothetical protein